ncbi:MAG TPA: carboxylesterase family protein [Caulobacterales bacterium]|nr:carboxylesterase family protein [Caulobacterales bacterium]
MKGWRVALFAAAANLLAGPALAQQEPVVRTALGSVRGELREDGTSVFRGMPFAAPPVGVLRWRPPQPASSWRGVRAATRPGAACAQNSYGWNEADARRSSEDCLYLDVRTPRLGAGARLPVLVWIHGGSNRAGSGGDKVLASFPLRGIVMVGVQYRLGAFGFVSHPELTAESTERASGNYALMDQVAALKWVRTNIAAFGGDPSNVTIVGDSAGAQDVGLLMVSPTARGLFAKAIQESGTAQFGWPARSLRENEEIGLQLQRLLGAHSLRDMREASTAQILAADLRMSSATITDQSYLWLQAVVDGRVVPAPPHDLFAAGLSANVPLLLGSNARELTLPGGADQAEAYLRMAFGPREALARSLYAFGGVADPRLGDAYEQLANDVTFRCPTVETARLQARRGRAVYQYHFDHAEPDGSAVRHSGELAFVYDDLPVSPRDRRITMQAYWANFARTGDPNAQGLPRWPRFQERERAYLEFSDDGPRAKTNLRGEICALLPRL